MSVITYSEFKSKYRFDCQLSQGSFGRVCRIQENSTRKYYALKKVAVKRKQQLQDIQNEIRLLHQYRHPFVVQIKETYNIQIKSGFAKPIWQVGLIMELAKCSLEQMIRMKKEIGSFQHITQQTAGLINVLFILQKQNIAHRDIKPANILLFPNPENSFYWKLADFGLALNLNNCKQQDNFAGSYEYASPKLKRKFKYPNLKVKTNPFKDDVYSLGVTLLQTLTGLRNYNDAAYEKLREVCHQKRLVDLVDMMLQQDEQKRPCFKQLILIMEKDFKQQLQNVNHQNKLNTNLAQPMKKMHKKSSHNLQPSQFDVREQDPDKTVIKIQNRTNVYGFGCNSQKFANKNINMINHQSQYKNIKRITFQFGANRPIQCIANLDGVLMCGCDNGQILFVKNNNIVQCGQVHKRMVSQIYDDSHGNLWTVGGDNFIRKWHKNSLIKALLSQVQTVKHTNNFLFSSQQKQIQFLPIKNTFCQQINLPFSHNCGISFIFCVNSDNFAVGYFDGHLYVKWNGLEFHARIFKSTVTSIKSDKERMWVCSIDGQIKIINLKQCMIQNKMFSKNQLKFVSILFSESKQQQQTVSLITLDAHQYLFTSNLQSIFQHSLTFQNSQTQNNNAIMATVESIVNKNYYILSQKGEIIDSSQQKVISLGGKGWNCIAMGDQNEIIVGSFTGTIAIIQW